MERAKIIKFISDNKKQIIFALFAFIYIYLTKDDDVHLMVDPITIAKGAEAAKKAIAAKEIAKKAAIEGAKAGAIEGAVNGAANKDEDESVVKAASKGAATGTVVGATKGISGTRRHDKG